MKDVDDFWSLLFSPCLLIYGVCFVILLIENLESNASAGFFGLNLISITIFLSYLWIC